MDREITLICTVRKTMTIPDNLHNEDEVREYLHWAYSNSELMDDPDDVTIEEIENCPYEKDECDDFDDMWHSGDFE